MWEFIKYCLYCVGLAYAGAFGNNPPGLTWKTAIIGIITMVVLCVLGVGILRLILTIIYKFR